MAGTAVESLADQQRWNRYGADKLRERLADPNAHQVVDFPFQQWPACCEMLGLLRPFEGKRILELGCGGGEFAVWLAKRGSCVTAIDLGPDLIAAAKALAVANGVDCDFRQGTITDLPFETGNFDAVVGMAILHHLSESDVVTTIRESHRVLKRGGVAAFTEPVENSRLFDLLQNLIPVSGAGGYRPSILQRRAWADYVAARDDRAMTTPELLTAGEGLFSGVKVSPHGFLRRLTRLFGQRAAPTLTRVDRFLFAACPPLTRFCQNVLVRYVK